MPALTFPLNSPLNLVGPTLPRQNVAAWNEAKALSGIEINQNTRPSDPSDYLVPTDWVYQSFVMPDDYARGTLSTEIRRPDITGISVCVATSDAENAYLDYRLELQQAGVGYAIAAEGTVTVAATEGDQLWFDIYFDRPIEMNAEQAAKRLRLGVRGNVDKVWYSSPTPYPLERLMDEDQNTLVADAALMFRVLTASADSGSDFLGNPYRSVAIRLSSGQIRPGDPATTNSYWLSKPNPSKFAVECLYFDVRDDFGKSSTMDRILLDPLTPGVYFHVYYSDEGEAGTTTDEWENKLWKHVPQTFRMDRRQEHALPVPLTTKYICLEFSHLQAQYYSPGTFQQSTTYRKHPKWVLDYFLLRTEATTGDPFIARNVEVQYDALDIAYNYYLDDLQQEPNGEPVPVTTLSTFLSSRNDASDQIDTRTLDQISRILDPYRYEPGSLDNGLDYLLGVYTATPATTYPTERLPDAPTLSSFVSTLDREAVVFEQTYPVMYFYLTSRHFYRKVQATFQYDRAYFAGVREVAFTRDHYEASTDTALYIDGLSDLTNSWINDFYD